MTSTTSFAICLALAGLVSTGCSETSNGPNISLSDADVPADAEPLPEPEVCEMTDCAGLCVDTQTDSLNCGGCGLACDSAGQICSGALPCACPEPFVTAEVGGSAFDMAFMQGTSYAAISAMSFSPINIFAVVYDLDLEIGAEYDVADALINTAPPTVAVGYDTDVATRSAKTPYAATSGTLVFDTICADGASGTVTNVVFEEVAGATTPIPVEGGCTMEYDSISFNVGSCPEPSL